MAATMQTITAITKERYQGALRKQLAQDTVALSRIQRSSSGVTSEVGGKYVTFPIHVSRNTGIGARNELERLPRPGQQGTRAVRIGLKYLYGSMQLSGQALALASSNPEAFISALDLETQGLRDDLAKDLNRQVYGDGDGTLTTVVSRTGNVLTVTDAKYVDIGMAIDVIQPNGTLRAADHKVVKVDEDANEITVTGTLSSVTANDILVRTGNYDREWFGFSRLVNDDRELFDIDPDIEPVWKSYVDKPGSPRSISETLLLATVNEVKRKGGKITAMFTSPGVWLSYFNLLQQQRQYVNTTDFTGGYKGLALMTPDGEVPVVQDFDAPKETLYGINEKNIKIYRESDWSFMDRDGSMWHRTPGYDAYEAILYQYSQLGLDRRNSHFVLGDLTETTV